MPLEQVANGETGLVVRGKINAGLTAIDANTTAIAAKADASTTTTALAAKADASAMTTALALKADASAVTTSLAAKADASSVTTSLALKADLASPALTGNPTAPTQTAGNNTTRVATTAFVTTAVAAVGSVSPAAPGTKITFTATTTDTSNQLTAISSMTGLAVGQEITKVGIMAGTTITALNVGASSLTLSQNASFTDTGTGYAYPLGTTGTVAAAPAVSKSNTFLHASGSFRGALPPWLYNFDNPRLLRNFRKARGDAMSRYAYVDNGIPNNGRNIIYFTDNEGQGSDPNIANWSFGTCEAAMAILGQRTDGAFSGEAIQPRNIYDERLTGLAGTGWEDNNISTGFTKFAINYSTDASILSMSFTDTAKRPIAWNIMDFLVRGNACYRYRIDGGSWTSVTRTGRTDRLYLESVTAPTLKVQTFEISWNGVADTALIVGPAMPRVSTRPQVRAWNLGGGGVDSLTYNGTGFGATVTPAILKAELNPALAVLHFGYEVSGNREGPTASAATVVNNFVTNMGVAITALKAQNIDIVFNSMHPWDDGNLYKDQATVAMVREASYDIAATHNIPFVDNFMRHGSWGEMLTAGLIEHYARPLPSLAWDNAHALATALDLV